MVLPQPSSFLQLPPEILLQVIDHLPYPDALSLKSTHESLEQMIAPTLDVGRRVEWLVERAASGLGLPRLANLNLRNDTAFATNPEVDLIITQRRRHEDCRIIAKAQLTALCFGGELCDDADDDTDNDNDVTSQSHEPQPHQSRPQSQLQSRRSRLSCALNPATGRCEGVRIAIKDQANHRQSSPSTWLYKITTMILHLVLSVVENVRRFLQTMAIHITNLNPYTYIMNSSLALGLSATLSDLSSNGRQQQLGQMLIRLWTCFEISVLVLILAHLFVGLDLRGIVPFASFGYFENRFGVSLSTSSSS